MRCDQLANCVESSRGQRGSTTRLLTRECELALDVRSSSASSTATIHASHLGFISALRAASFHGVDVVDRVICRPSLRRRRDGPRCSFLCFLIYCTCSSSGVDGDDRVAVSSAVSARSHVGLRVVVSTVHGLISLGSSSVDVARDPTPLLFFIGCGGVSPLLVRSMGWPCILRG